MKYCPHCKQWNHGKPIRCRHCGRTWNVKLCSAGHVNPANANFCGECGRSNLSEPADGRGLLVLMLSYLKYPFYYCLIYFGLPLVLSTSKVPLKEGAMDLIMCLVILLFALKLALKYIQKEYGISGQAILRKLISFTKWLLRIGER